MQVKNRSYIINLAKKILNNNRNRRNVLLASIALTCVLFTSLFSVVLGLSKSMEFQTMKFVGTTSHGSFKEVSDKDIKVLSRDPDIKEFSIRTKVGVLDNEKIMAELSFMDKKGFDWSLMENVKGHLPEKENEIFIDISTAKKLGYKGNIGEEIHIPFNIEKAYTGEVLEHKEQDFIISGTYQEPIVSNTGVGQIYLSKNYVNKLNLPVKQNDMEVMLNSSWKIEKKLVNIADRNGYRVIDNTRDLADKEIRIGVNFAYLSNKEEVDLAAFFPVLALIILIFLAGFLIINNIFKISVSEDIKLFGLLKTIGMTKPQIKNLVHMESLIAAFPSLMIGSILGVAIGKIILNNILSNNFMLSNIELSITNFIIIILCSIGFTLLTVFISVNRPAKYASKISPIEASRYNEIEIKKSYSSENISLNKLARRQVFSNKFRFISIILSMSLSAVILNSVLTYTGNIDLKKGISDVIVTDYNVASPKYFSYMYISSDDSLPKSFIEEIESHEGFKNGGALYSYGSNFSYPDVKIQNKRVAPTLLGIDEYLLSKQELIEGEFDRNQWNSNDYVIIGEDVDKGSSFTVGDKILIDFKGHAKEVQIMGKMNYNFSNGLRYTTVDHENRGDETSPVLKSEYIYMPPNLYKEITGDKSLMSYGFDVKDKNKREFNRLLKEFESDPRFSYDSRDLQIESSKNFKNLIEFVGYSLALILFLISILNFINIIATDIIKNTVNLSMLEAIGMTRKNIKTYLLKKNLIYSVSSLMLSLIIMTLVNKFILMDFMRSTRWTSFNFVILPLIIVNMANMIIGTAFTAKFYEKHSEASLIDRIRSFE